MAALVEKAAECRANEALRKQLLALLVELMPDDDHELYDEDELDDDWW